MPSISSVFSSFKSPGVKVVESTSGYRSLEIASHSAIYMIGSSATGPSLVPTQVINLTDFTNQFGASPSTDEVKLLFRNDKRANFYFVRALVAPRRRITISSAAAGAYTVSITGTTTLSVTYTATGTPTLASVASGLLAAINSSTIANEVVAFAGPTTDQIYVRLRNPSGSLTVTATTGNLTATVDNPTTPQAYDYVYAIEAAFDLEDDYSQGFLIAPEAFQGLATQSDRLAVGNALIAQASDEAFDWVALIDVGSGLTPAQAKAEALLYSSPQGHCSVYWPYLTDLEDAVVPPSAAVAGLASKRYREEGYPQPPAGAKYPLLGVKDVVTKVNTQIQDDLNPSGLNVIRNLRGRGVCVWGMRTRSSDSFYTFVHTRVIMNVLNGTLRRGFTNEVFSVVDGQGIFLNAISQTAASVCSRLWREKALFGATEAQAFEVKCDFENNPPSQLENGQVLLEVYAATAPAMEKLLINTVRVNIGTLPQNTNQLDAQILTQE